MDWRLNRTVSMDWNWKPCTTTGTKLWDVRKNNTGIDRFTYLPQELLIKILSLLPTKDAAATRVLSRRMRHVFPWITCLDFDVSRIWHPLQVPKVWKQPNNLVEHFPNFVTFVDNVIQSFKSPYLTKFRLRISTVNFRVQTANGCSCRCRTCIRCPQGCLPDLKFTHLNAWISFPLSFCGLRELNLCILVKEPGDDQLPPAIFTCETLEVLKLEVNLGLDQVITMPSYRLPNLKKLLLRASFISNDDFLPRLVSSCPVLEDLAFEAFTNHVHHTSIYSTSLKRLTLHMHKVEYSDFSDLVLIHTPNLEYLDYYDDVANKYSIPRIPRLVNADVCIMSIERINFFQQLISLLKALSHVQQLSLRGIIVLEFYRAEEQALKAQLPVFPNLQHLELGYHGDNYYWNKFLLQLLICSPVLKTLIFSEGLIQYYTPDLLMYSLYKQKEEGPLKTELEYFRAAHAIPSCCRYHLKRIEVRDYFGTKREVEMISFFLRHALVLEKLVIRFACRHSFPIPDRMSVQYSIKKLPRASINCSIEVT